MASECWMCKEREATSVGMIEFVYDDLKVRIFKDGMSCRQCAENYFAECFRKYSYLLKRKKGEITAIDWKGFCKECEKNKETEIVEIFLGLGIFSTDPDGNWEIVSDHPVPLDPKFSLSIVYFVNFADAVCYAQEKFPHTQYGWSLRNIGVSYNKSRIIGLGPLDRNEINFNFTK